MSWFSGTVRKIVIAASAVIAVVGSFIGSGAAGGTPIQDAAGGALSASATAIAPAGPAFAIWSVVYVGLLAFAVWQFLPHRGDPALRRRHDRIGIAATLSLLLNAAWILSVQAGLLQLSWVVIVALLAVLAWTFVLLRRDPSRSRTEAVVTDGTFGLYLGWVCVATVANIAAVLSADGFQGFGLGQDLWGSVVAAVAGGVGLLVAVTGRGRIAPTLSLGWGLVWVAVARLDGPLVSVPTAVTALVATLVVVATTAAIRLGAVRRSSTATA
ncbi:TspO/MBR family protein [Curtobacterium sp. RRHDQ10]|uniref:TspO/MBR family protein n=1 Tax=Curtobacterium phyllosphaerae TaxID=3413379 RepID=UPI003BF0FA5B